MSGITIECNNLQSVSEITELIFGQNKNHWSKALVSAKIPQSIMSLKMDGKESNKRENAN